MSTDASALAVFQRYSKYYDLLYRDKDYSAETDYIDRTLRAVAPKGKRLLEFGSGTGKHGRLLAKRGYQVFGVERSEVMASIAKAEGKGDSPGTFDCMQGDIRTVKAPGAPYDAVLSLFHVVSYLTSNDDLLATFRNAASQLVEGGIFFFDVWHGPAVLKQRPAVRLKTVEDGETRLRRIAEPAVDESKSIVTVHYTMFAESKIDGSITTFDEKHNMRYLFPTEIELLATQTDFVVERMEEFGSGAPASADTWGVAYVLRRATARK